MDSNKNILLDYVNPKTRDLSYTCFLIPRLLSQQLQGDLAVRLPQWVRQICASCNWELEFITVNADYFQWGLSVVPSTQTRQFMLEIRQKTSDLILSTFEHTRNESSVSDFWAPGYLVVLGTRSDPEEIIEQYIRLLRRHREHVLADL